MILIENQNQEVDILDYVNKIKNQTIENNENRKKSNELIKKNWKKLYLTLKKLSSLEKEHMRKKPELLYSWEEIADNMLKKYDEVTKKSYKDFIRSEKKLNVFLKEKSFLSSFSKDWNIKKNELTLEKEELEKFYHHRKNERQYKIDHFESLSKKQVEMNAKELKKHMVSIEEVSNAKKKLDFIYEIIKKTNDEVVLYFLKDFDVENMYRASLIRKYKDRGEPVSLTDNNFYYSVSTGEFESNKKLKEEFEKKQAEILENNLNQNIGIAEKTSYLMASFLKEIAPILNENNNKNLEENDIQDAEFYEIKE